MAVFLYTEWNASLLSVKVCMMRNIEQSKERKNPTPPPLFFLTWTLQMHQHAPLHRQALPIAKSLTLRALPTCKGG